MMRKTKLLVFLTARFQWENGGVLWAKTLLENLARVPEIDGVVVSTGFESTGAANHEFVSSLGFEHIFIPFKEERSQPGRAMPVGIAGTIHRVVNAAAELVVDKYYFCGERVWRKQGHVNSAFRTIVEDRQPDLLLVDNIYSAFFVPAAFSGVVPCCLITQDNDVLFYRSLKAQGGRPSMSGVVLWLSRHFNGIADMRVRRQVNRIYQRCAGVVTLTKNDMPSDLRNDVVKAVISPVLSERKPQWSHHGNRCILFVGNMFVGDVMHFANRLAIEWICTHLGPELARLSDEVRINIIGAASCQVPGSWRSSNINFMGAADKEEVVRQLTTADIFVAPIASSFGAKMKLAECVAHGTPFVATEAAMSGLPFLTCIPTIDLHNAGAAARMILDSINDPIGLTLLSRSIVSCAEQARSDQDVAWMTFIGNCMARRTDVTGAHGRTTDSKHTGELPA